MTDKQEDTLQLINTCGRCKVKFVGDGRNDKKSRTISSDRGDNNSINHIEMNQYENVNSPQFAPTTTQSPSSSTPEQDGEQFFITSSESIHIGPNWILRKDNVAENGNDTENGSANMTFMAESEEDLSDVRTHSVSDVQVTVVDIADARPTWTSQSFTESTPSLANTSLSQVTNITALNEPPNGNKHGLTGRQGSLITVDKKSTSQVSAEGVRAVPYRISTVDGATQTTYNSRDNLAITNQNMTEAFTQVEIPDGRYNGHNKSSNNKDNMKKKATSSKKRQSIESMDEDEKWLLWVEEQFNNIAGEDNEIDLNEFKTALKVKQSFFAERFFALFDSDKSGTIELQELMDGLHMMINGTDKQKLKFLFDVYDVDGSGTIDREELKTVLKSCTAESSMQISDDDMQALTDALFDDADEDNSGAITFEELVAELEKYPGVMDNLTMSAANWMKPPEEKKKKLIQKHRYFSKKYIMNNMRKVVFFLVYLLINMGLSGLSIYRYWESNYCVIIARMMGMCLNFNCTFIVVLMLRYCLTWLRTTPAAIVLPLDQNIFFHKIVGIFIAIQSFIHTVAHLGNIALVKYDSPSVESYSYINDALNSTSTEAFYDDVSTAQPPVNLAELTWWEFLFTLKSGVGWIGPGFGYLSGVILDVVLFIMVLCSMPFVRRSGHFQVFYWTHMLYVVFWVVLILHGPMFWKFFCVPGFIFIIERIKASKFAKLARYGSMYITEVSLLSSKVTHLVISRPDSFRYKPGDYVFINIPDIAQYEWHPFTISSNPEKPGEIWLHVRSAGHWTNKLYEFFENYKEPSMDELNRKKKRAFGYTYNTGTYIADIENSNVALSNYTKPTPADKMNEKEQDVNSKKTSRRKNKRANVTVFVDGPFGTSTREIFESEHVVLIASGIGVTPYASILQSIASRYNELKRRCPNCEHVWYDDTIGNDSNTMKLKRVDFVWINRSQSSFEWFVSLLANLEMEQANDPNFQDFLHMQMYMTSALGKNDMKAVGLQMAMEILHKKDNKDLLTGLKTRTQAGRPDWDDVFGTIKKERKSHKVKVFFCGSPQLAKTLKAKCEKFKFHFSKENF